MIQGIKVKTKTYIHRTYEMAFWTNQFEYLMKFDVAYLFLVILVIV